MILVVEDDDALRATLETVLGDAGYVVKAMSNGPEAVVVASRDRPALVILDLSLRRGIDGLGVARALRARYGPNLPIVLASGSPELKQVAYSIRAAAVIAKPFGIDDLLGTVQRLLAAG